MTFLLPSMVCAMYYANLHISYYLVLYVFILPTF